MIMDPAVTVENPVGSPSEVPNDPGYVALKHLRNIIISQIFVFSICGNNPGVPHRPIKISKKLKVVKLRKI